MDSFKRGVFLKVLDKEEFFRKIEELDKEGREYWSHSKEVRWQYMSVVCEELERINPRTVLELGAYKINLTDISDNMCLEESFADIDNKNSRLYTQDATVLPWGILDKFYDCFVALQVFEHLKNKQVEVFKEVKRISNYAFLSFPYKWMCLGDCHHGIDEYIISKWTDSANFYKVVKTQGRIVYFFRF